MKKVFIAGMAMVVASTMASNAFAAATVAKPKAIIAVEKMEKASRDKAFGEGKSAKDVPADKIDVTITAISEWIKPGMGKELVGTLKSDPSKTADRLDTLALIYATKEIGTKVEQTNPAEGKSLKEAAESSLEVLAVAELTKTESKKKARDLSEKDNEAVLKGIAKFESETPAQIKSYSIAERDSWSVVKKDYALNMRTAKFDSPAEALIQSLMKNVTNGDRAKAIEIMRKLSDCV